MSTRTENRQQIDNDEMDRNTGGRRSRRRRSKGRFSVRKERIYDKVARPRTPYIMYVMDEEARKKAERKAGRDGDIRMALADTWNNLSDKEKEKYDRMFEDDIRRYEEECNEIDEHRKGKGSVKKGSRDQDQQGSGKKKKRINRKQNQKGTANPEEYDDYGDGDSDNE